MKDIRLVIFNCLFFLGFYFIAGVTLASDLTFGQLKRTYDLSKFGVDKVTCDDLIRSAVRSSGDLYLRNEDKYIASNILSFYTGVYSGMMSNTASSADLSNSKPLDDKSAEALLKSIVSACADKKDVIAVDYDVGKEVIFPSINLDSIYFNKTSCKDYSEFAATFAYILANTEIIPDYTKGSDITEHEYLEFIIKYFFLDGLMATYGLSPLLDYDAISAACNANDKQTKIIDILNLLYGQ